MMGNTVHTLVSMMISVTFVQNVRTTSVTFIGLDSKMCSRSSSAYPQYLNENELYEIRWNGTVLPSVCRLVFQANGHRTGSPDRTNYRTCVKANAFNVTDCRFSMTVEKNRNGMETVKKCGDTNLKETCTEPGEPLYIVFYASAVTQGLVSLTVLAKRVEKDSTKSQALVFSLLQNQGKTGINMVLLIATVIGSILLMTLVVLISIYIFSWNKERQKTDTDDHTPAPFHCTVPKSYYMYSHRFSFDKTDLTGHENATLSLTSETLPAVLAGMIQRIQVKKQRDQCHKCSHSKETCM